MFLKKDSTIEDVKAALPNVYQEIFNAGKATIEDKTPLVQSLEAQVAELNNQLASYKAAEALAAQHNKIKSFGEKMKCSTFTAGMLEENPNISIEEAFLKISENTDTDKEPLQEAQEIFEQTAPASAGNGTKDDLSHEEITNSAQAVNMIMKRDGVSKGQATKLARREYAALFVNEPANN